MGNQTTIPITVSQAEHERALKRLARYKKVLFYVWLVLDTCNIWSRNRYTKKAQEYLEDVMADEGGRNKEMMKKIKSASRSNIPSVAPVSKAGGETSDQRDPSGPSKTKEEKNT